MTSLVYYYHCKLFSTCCWHWGWRTLQIITFCFYTIKTIFFTSYTWSYEEIVKVECHCTGIRTGLGHEHKRQQKVLCCPYGWCYWCVSFWQNGNSPVQAHFVGIWQCSSNYFVHKEAETGPAAGLMTSTPARLLVSPPWDWANLLVTINIHVNYIQYVKSFKVSKAVAVFKLNISISDSFDLCLMTSGYCQDITAIYWPVKRQQPVECACGCGSWIKPQGDGLHAMPHRTFWWTHMRTGKIERQ